ncbi:PIN domain-containing protein [Terrimonas ferruginea]|uniref:PIN domain-containing protein n=1 Tax=Terrimonas ferruginea TaxID=249 RepID=UPI00040A0DB9|nr:PIN domain-containing protein [Terrimonas ferruginea]
MIYLTFDSNIWIYLLDNSWTLSNPLDHLEHWIDEKHIGILVPDIILTEWNNHKEAEKEYRVKKLKDFFRMAQELIPSPFIDEHNKPDNLSHIVEEQFSRIEKLIQTNSRILPIESATRLKAVEWGVAKKAPMHKKSSMADTLIVWTVIDFAIANPGHDYFFISNNTEDFYEGAPKKIHSHLKDHFETNKIKESRWLAQVIEELKLKLPVSIDIEAAKKERIIAKLEHQVYNPTIQKVVSNAEDSYLSNTTILDGIIGNPSPTPAQMAFAISLTKEDNSYAYHFYKNLKNALWLDHLIELGVYKPANNPLTEKTDKGFISPLWSPLLYLLNLAKDASFIADRNNVEKIIAIIDPISKDAKDNSRTWHLIIEIVIAIPNEIISIDFLGNIPVWVSSKFDNYIVGVRLCEDLLPKFLNAHSSPDALEKGEIVIREIFRLYRSEQSSPYNKKPGELYSPIFDYYLAKVSHQEQVIKQVVSNSKDELILYISSQLTRLLLDYPKGITTSIKAGTNRYSLIAFVKQKDALFVLRDVETENVIGETTITDFLSASESKLETSILSFLADNNIAYNAAENESHTLDIIIINLLRGKSYQLDSTPLYKLEADEDEKDLVAIFTKMLIALIREYVIQFPEQASSFLEQYWEQHPLPAHRRVILHIITGNWATTRLVFTSLLSKHPSVFYSHDYETEIYWLLKNNSGLFFETEIATVKQFIEKGPDNLLSEEHAESRQYWQLKWYAALKDHPEFGLSYKLLSEKFKRTQEDFDNEGEVRVRFGTVSPFTTEEILEKSNKEIVQFMLHFKPKDSWEEPNIDGMAERLGKAVESQPARFVEEIKLYLDVPFIYFYHMLNGLIEAWKNKQSFDWEKIIDFCTDYIDQPKFISGELKQAADSWHADSEWITGSIGRLLSSGMQHDENAFDASLLPKTKRLLLRLSQGLEIPKQGVRDKMDYPTYSLNSTAGKVLRALFDYSLKWARVNKTADEDEKWESDVKAAFEATMRKGIIDGFILQGMYFHQFYWLDKNWLTQHVNSLLTIEEDKWMAFMGGYSFSNAPNSKEVYAMMYPHYEKVIEKQLEFSNFNERTIVLHLVSYLFWGYETIKEKKLSYLYLTVMPPEAVSDFIQFISRNEKYYNQLKEEDKPAFQAIILSVWQLVHERFSTPDTEDEKTTVAALAKFLPFMATLDDTVTALILDSVTVMSEYYHWHELIEDLLTISETATNNQTAANIGKILLASDGLPLHTSYESEKLITLVTYLYENGQKATANKICDAISRQGNDFLREVYKKYNP